MAREATPEEAAAFHKASGVDPRLENALGIDTSAPVREPGGAPVPVSKSVREATPEEVAAFHAPDADFKDVTSGGGSTVNGSGLTQTFGDRAAHPTAPPGLLQTIGHNLQQGLTFGQNNKLDALLSPGDYSANLAKNDTQSAAEEAAHPIAAPIANFIGGIGSPANPLIGKALGAVAGPLARRFPALADRLAMRVSNLTPKSTAARVLQNAKNPAGAGKYAEDALKEGLVKLTPQGTLDAAASNMRQAGSELGTLRAGQSVPIEQVKGLTGLVSAGAPEEAATALGNLSKGLPVSPARNVGLDELAQLTEQHVGDPLKQMRLKGASPLGPYINPENPRTLQAAKEGLEQLQRSAIGEANVPAYEAAQKSYAIGSEAARGTAKAMARPQSLTKAVTGGAGRTAAYAALKAYQVTRSPAMGAIARVAAKAGPAAASTLSQAQLSDNPVQQGAALMQAQANDSGARGALKDED